MCATAKKWKLAWQEQWPKPAGVALTPVWQPNETHWRKLHGTPMYICRFFADEGSFLRTDDF